MRLRSIRSLMTESPIRCIAADVTLPSDPRSLRLSLDSTADRVAPRRSPSSARPRRAVAAAAERRRRCRRPTRRNPRRSPTRWLERRVRRRRRNVASIRRNGLRPRRRLHGRHLRLGKQREGVLHERAGQRVARRTGTSRHRRAAGRAQRELLLRPLCYTSAKITTRGKIARRPVAWRRASSSRAARDCGPRSGCSATTSPPSDGPRRVSWTSWRTRGARRTRRAPRSTGPATPATRPSRTPTRSGRPPSPTTTTSTPWSGTRAGARF